MHMWRSKLEIILIASVCVLMVLYLSRSYKAETFFLRGKLRSNGNYERTKSVVFWTKFFGKKFWGMQNETYNEEDLKAIGCSRTNCEFTFNKTHLKNPSDYDAIVFHGAEKWTADDLYGTRSPRQVYVMMSKESPGETKRDFKLDHDFYNLTINYRLDSDILMSYGSTVDLERGIVVAPAYHAQWRRPDNDFYDEEISLLVAGKTKTAAWFVSHCNASSQRDQLVRKLQKFIDVDVYGKCGTLSCPYRSNKCDEMLNSTYKFYFAFENALCIDYVTEKLFNAMKMFIVPVVYSGADLSRFVPPKSYIDANDFETTEELASYLKYLSRTPREYIKYFWWRKHYKIVPSSDAHVICDLCEKLNEQGFGKKPNSYVDIYGWFYKGACSKPKIQF